MFDVFTEIIPTKIFVIKVQFLKNGNILSFTFPNFENASKFSVVDNWLMLCCLCNGILFCIVVKSNRKASIFLFVSGPNSALNKATTKTCHICFQYQNVPSDFKLVKTYFFDITETSICLFNFYWRLAFDSNVYNLLLSFLLCVCSLLFFN